MSIRLWSAACAMGDCTGGAAGALGVAVGVSLALAVVDYSSACTAEQTRKPAIQKEAGFRLLVRLFSGGS